jgi:Domain of unknown function (DUF6438)
MLKSGGFKLLWLFVASAVCSTSRGVQPPYPVPDDTVIVLQRGNCEMGCPVYRVVIFADGDVIWEGRYRVRKTGLALSHIKPDQMREIIDQFTSIKYFDLQNIYNFRGQGCSDELPNTPTVTLLFSMNGHSKSLEHHRGCVADISKKLAAVEDTIDKITNTGQWVK